MRCGECGTENGTGVEFCAECGKTLAIALGSLSTDPGQDPGVAASFGFIPPAETPFDGETACNLCQKACPADELQKVEGTVFCPECAPFMAAGEDAAPEAAPKLRMTSDFSPGPADLPPEANPTATEPPTYGAEPEPAYSSVLEPPTFAQPMNGRSSERPIFVEKPARKFPVALFGLLVVVAVGGYLLWHFFLGRDRIDRLLAEAESSDRTVSLVPQLEQGQTWRYAADATVDFQMSGAAMGRSFDMDAEGGFDVGFYLDVLDVNASGTATLQVAIESVKGDLTFDGNVPEMDELEFSKSIEELEGETYEIQMDRRGRLIGNPSAQGELAAVLALAEDVPDGPIGVGQTWQQTVPVPGDIPGGAGKMTIDYRLIGFAKHLGHDCAVVEVESATSFAEKEMAMDIECKGAMFLDAADGHLVHLAVDMTLEATMTIVGSVSMDLVLTLDVRQQ